MRPLEDIAITLEAILEMGVAGLPTSERGLRRFVVANGWPVVYSANGKYLILTDAIPEHLLLIRLSDWQAAAMAGRLPRLD